MGWSDVRWFVQTKLGSARDLAALTDALDGLVAVALVGVALAIDAGARAGAQRWRARRGPVLDPLPTDPEPELVAAG